MARSTAAWASKPGNFDALHLDPLYGIPVSANPDGIPSLTPGVAIDANRAWVAFDAIRSVQPTERPNTVIHTFVDDYRLEVLWNRPKAARATLEGFAAVCSPDFSVYSAWPEAINRFNIYRSRWCGAWWQCLDLPVIPTVNWADAMTFGYAFAGIAPNSPVAIRTPDWRNADAVEAFNAGYVAMQYAIQPSDVWLYGSFRHRRYHTWKEQAEGASRVHCVPSRQVGRPIVARAD